jgi:hypothetical protein
MDKVPEAHPAMTLSGKTQLAGFVIAAVLAALLVGGAYLLLVLAKGTSAGGASPSTADILLWALVGGFVGGAARSLFMFIWEVGGHAEESPSQYLAKWFLYLVKPVMGSAGGLFFVLTVNLGLVSFFSGNVPVLDFLRVCLTAVLGGVFFESVFALLHGVMPKS